MDTASLTTLFAPRSIAVVGASSSPTKVGGLPLDYQRRFGFDGALYAINPKATEVQGLQAHPSLVAVGAPIDLAICAVPAALALAAVDDAIAASVRSMVMFTSGFAEVGEQGAQLQRLIGARARAAGLRLIGPNCLGFMNIARNIYATFTPAPLSGRVAPGRIGLVSQSGAFGAYAYLMARERGVGLSTWVTTGNEADLQAADCVAWLADDEQTDVIMAYLEACRDGPRLRAALALAQARGKPVVMVKVGRSALGAQAAASHTAALAGDDAVYDALFKAYGVLRAHSLREWFDLASSAAVAPRPHGHSVGVLTVSGGVAAMMADEAAQGGLELTPLSDTAQATLRSWVPFSAARNPVDITGQVTNDATLLERAARLMLQDQPYASWLGFFGGAGLWDDYWPVLLSLIKGLRAEYPELLLAVSTLLAPARRAELEAQHCLVFNDPTDAIRTIAALARLRRPGLPPTRALAAASLTLPPGALSEPASLALLRQAGVPVVDHRLAADRQQAAAAARELGGELVLKVASADIPHKSDIGGVVLGLQGESELVGAWDQMMARVRAARPDAVIDGALVARRVRGGVECIAGVRVDPVFGPVLLFGLGGVFVETLRDVSLRLLPIERSDALDMIRELRGFAILRGVRGDEGVDLDSIADTLLALAELAQRTGPSLASAEINPLLARPRTAGGCVAVDALVVGRAADETSATNTIH